MFDRAEYNGIKLLPLPETLDVSEFPYLLFLKDGNNIVLYAFTEKVFMSADNFLTAGPAGTVRRFSLKNDSYEQIADLSYSGGVKIFQTKFIGILWSNWDIQYPIGGVYFYGSKPIPTTRWISHRFDADFVKKENRIIINAMQNDDSSRTFIISLLENGEKWFPPEETEIYLLYKRPDGQNGLVSDVAVLTENVVSLIPPKDVFEVNGTVLASVAFKFGTNTLSTFNFEIQVEKDPSIAENDSSEVPDDSPEVPDTPITTECLTFASGEPFTLSVSSPQWDGAMEYFNGDEGWKTWDGSEISSGNFKGDQCIFVRGSGNTIVSGYSTDGRFVFSETGRYIWCVGNIENLLDYTSVKAGIHPVMNAYCFFCLFFDCTALVAPPSLPATTLADYCYSFMFSGCTSLATAPNILATTLADHCYEAMFARCTKLTKAPSLPATTLERGCYAGMFDSCTSLRTAPSLPATTLADNCYESMFIGCCNLTTVPSLPAATLTKGCYYHMFDGCTGIKLSIYRKDEYQKEYRIPYSEMGTAEHGSLDDMFTGTGGTFAGTPTLNRTYHLDESITIV
jgi:hypothetical protein